MLVLSRGIDKAIVVDGPARIVVIAVRGNVVRLGIDAAPGVEIRREELPPRAKVADDAGPGSVDGIPGSIPRRAAP